jgi:hypothetical protein
MHFRDIAVATVLFLSGVGLALGLTLHVGGLVAASVVLGTLAVTCAVAILLVISIVLLYRSFSGTAGDLLRRSWLGLVNGAIGAAIWGLFVWSYGS